MGGLSIADVVCYLVGVQFDAIPVNVVAVAQQQVAERPRRYGDRAPR